MALHSKKEFSEMCGMQSKDLAVYIRRGKVIAQGEWIDSNLAENKLFLEKRKAKAKKPEKTAGTKNKKSAPKEIVIPKVEPPVIPPPDIPDLPDDEISEPVTGVPSSLRGLEVALKQADLVKTRKQTEELRLKIERQKGVVIPTDIVKSIFAQHFKSVSAAFHQGAENLLVEINKMKNLDQEETAYIRGRLVQIINQAIDESISDSKKSIRNIVNEYSAKRGPGQRK